MRRFLAAFICLSALAMTQNVVVGTADAADLRGASWTTPPVAGVVSERAHTVGAQVPEASTMMLLVVGLAGLTAASGRRDADETGDPAA